MESICLLGCPIDLSVCLSSSWFLPTLFYYASTVGVVGVFVSLGFFLARWELFLSDWFMEFLGWFWDYMDLAATWIIWVCEWRGYGRRCVLRVFLLVRVVHGGDLGV